MREVAWGRDKEKKNPYNLVAQVSTHFYTESYDYAQN